MKPCAWPLFFAFATSLAAHPMGNFSVSHYARIEVSGAGAQIRYVLDLAEIPSFQLLQQWALHADSPRAVLDAQGDRTGSRVGAQPGAGLRWARLSAALRKR